MSIKINNENNDEVISIGSVDSYFNGGNVGFNVSFPSTALEIDGGIRATGYEFIQETYADGYTMGKSTTSISKLTYENLLYSNLWTESDRQALAHKVLLNDTTNDIFCRWKQ